MTIYQQIRDRYADPEMFIARLKGQMALHEIRQVKLARRSGYSQAVVSRWLTDNKDVRVRPGLKAMVDLDEALDQIITGSHLQGN